MDFPQIITILFFFLRFRHPRAHQKKGSAKSRARAVLHPTAVALCLAGYFLPGLCRWNRRSWLQLAANPPVSFPLHNWASAALPIRSSAQALTSVYKSSVNNKEYSRKILHFFSSPFCQETHFSGYLWEAKAAEAQAAHKHRQFLHDYSWAIFGVFA